MKQELPPPPPAAIIALDEKLKLLRDGWIDSRRDKRDSWMQKIDAALDERLELMKL